MTKYFSDLPGIGESIGHVKELAQDGLKIWVERHERPVRLQALVLKNEEQELLNEGLKIKNMEARLALGMKYQISQDDLIASMAVPSKRLTVQTEEQLPLGLIS